MLELKQRYDERDQPIAGSFDPCAGNGCFDASGIPACGVSVRIPWVNWSRGPGCLMHSLGHGFEGMTAGGAKASAAVPSLAKNFAHFANIDLLDRQIAPFRSWYEACGDNCVTFTGPNTLTWRNSTGMTGTIAAYDQGCGSVHLIAPRRVVCTPRGLRVTFARLGRPTCHHQTNWLSARSA